LDISALTYVMQGDARWHQIQLAMDEAEAKGDYEKIIRLHSDLENIDGYTIEPRAAEMLHGLGFAPGSIRNSVKSFSGGWRMRLNLARALMANGDVLLLD